MVAIEGLLEILTAITAVSVVTPAIRNGLTFSDNYEVIETGGVDYDIGIISQALSFGLNQIKLSRTIWDRDESVILFFGPTSYVLPIAVAKIRGKTVVLEPRGNVPQSLRIEWSSTYPSEIANLAAGFVWLFERVGFRLANAIITLSPSMVVDLGLDPTSSTVFHDGAWHVDVSDFEFSPASKKDRPLIGYLGRLGEEKGIRDLVGIASEISDQYPFVFIGDGELRPWIESELGPDLASSKVEITGWIDHEDVPTHLRRLSLLVIPSATEGLPVTILEAFAVGTLVYAKPVGGVPDLIRDGETGFLMHEEGTEERVGRIKEILARDDQDQIRRQARHLVENKYSFDAAVDRYRKILSELL